MYIQEEPLSDHGDIMPLNIEVLRGKVNGSTDSPDIPCDNETYQSSDIMSLDNDMDFTEKTIDQLNITEQADGMSSSDAKYRINSDVEHPQKRIEEKENGCKQNISRENKISQKEGEIIPDKKQSIEVQENVNINNVPPNQTKKRRRRKKKQKNVDLHASVEEKALRPDIGTAEAVKKTNVKSEQISKVKSYSDPTGNCWKSREKPKLCLFVVVPLFFLSLVACNGTNKPSEVKWKMLTDIITFGKPVLLHCKKKGVGSFCNGTRRWTKGKSQSNLVHDGTSSNATKYKEKVDKDCSGAILYIYSFNEEDIGEYTCAHEFDEYTDTIKLETNSYRSYPDFNKIKKTMECGNKTFLVEFMLLDVYPIPICNVYTQVDKSTIEGTTQNVSRNSKLLTSNYKVHCKLNEHNCNGELYVLCSIGDKIIKIINHTYDCCKDFKRNLDEEDDEASYIILVPIIILLVLAVIVGLFVFRNRKAIYKCKCLNCKEYSEVKNKELNDTQQTKDEKCKCANG